METSLDPYRFTYRDGAGSFYTRHLPVLDFVRARAGLFALFTILREVSFPLDRDFACLS